MSPSIMPIVSIVALAVPCIFAVVYIGVPALAHMAGLVPVTVPIVPRIKQADTTTWRA